MVKGKKEKKKGKMSINYIVKKKGYVDDKSIAKRRPYN